MKRLYHKRRKGATFSLLVCALSEAKGMDKTMTEEQYEREKNYKTSRAIVKAMLDKGLVTEKEYKKIDTKLVGRYRPLFGSI